MIDEPRHVPKPIPTDEFYRTKATGLIETVVLRYAVPPAMLAELEEANFREHIALALLAVGGLKIGTVAADLVRDALVNLNARRRGSR